MKAGGITFLLSLLLLVACSDDLRCPSGTVKVGERCMLPDALWDGEFLPPSVKEVVNWPDSTLSPESVDDVSVEVAPGDQMADSVDGRSDLELHEVSGDSAELDLLSPEIVDDVVFHDTLEIVDDLQELSDLPQEVDSEEMSSADSNQEDTEPPPPADG